MFNFHPITNSCLSQEVSFETPATNSLKKSIERIEFSKLIMLKNELVESCIDTLIYEKFVTRIKSRDGIKQKTIQDSEEYYLNMHLLYRAVLKVEAKNEKSQKSKTAILLALNKYKDSNVEVTKDFILNQIDESRRGLGHGYDEGVTSESKFLFFCFNAILLRNVLKSKNIGSWERMSTFLCASKT